MGEIDSITIHTGGPLQKARQPGGGESVFRSGGAAAGNQQRMFRVIQVILDERDHCRFQACPEAGFIQVDSRDCFQNVRRKGLSRSPFHPLYWNGGNLQSGGIYAPNDG